MVAVVVFARVSVIVAVPVPTPVTVTVCGAVLPSAKVMVGKLTVATVGLLEVIATTKLPFKGGCVGSTEKVTVEPTCVETLLGVTLIPAGTGGSTFTGTVTGGTPL